MRVANELTEEMHHALGVGVVEGRLEGGAGGGSVPLTVPLAVPRTVPLTVPLSAQNDETRVAQQTRRAEPIARAEARETPLFLPYVAPRFPHMSEMNASFFVQLERPVFPICRTPFPPHVRDEFFFFRAA